MINQSRKRGKDKKKRLYVYFSPKQIDLLKLKASQKDYSVSSLIVGMVQRELDNEIVLDLEFEEGSEFYEKNKK